jgi:hypothetical protein
VNWRTRGRPRKFQGACGAIRAIEHFGISLIYDLAGRQPCALEDRANGGDLMGVVVAGRRGELLGGLVLIAAGAAAAAGLV